MKNILRTVTIYYNIMDLYIFVSITFIWIYAYNKIVCSIVIYIVSGVGNIYNISTFIYITGLKIKKIWLY